MLAPLDAHFSDSAERDHRTAERADHSVGVEADAPWRRAAENALGGLATAAFRQWAGPLLLRAEEENAHGVLHHQQFFAEAAEHFVLMPRQKRRAAEIAGQRIVLDERLQFGLPVSA